MSNLPDGVVYNPDQDGQKDCEEGEAEGEEFKDGDVVRVGDFIINIEKITKP